MRQRQILLIAIPVLLAGLVFTLTRREYPRYVSQTILSCSPVPYPAAVKGGAAGFQELTAGSDNLITLIRSQETLRETGIRLLSQHLLLDRSDPRFISTESYSNLLSITPSYLYKFVPAKDSARNSSTGPINREIYEQTVRNLTTLAERSDTNFVSRLLRGDHQYYSIKALSGIKVRRIGKTGMIKLVCGSGDPGISQQTLAILTDVCRARYGQMMGSGNMQLIKDPEAELPGGPATSGLPGRSLTDPPDHENGYPVKDSDSTPYSDLVAEYRHKKSVLAGMDDYIGTLEGKLTNNLRTGLKSDQINRTIERLEASCLKFASIDLLTQNGKSNIQKLAYLNLQAGKIKDELRSLVTDLSNSETSADRSAYAAILSEWADNMIEAVNVRANLKTLEGRLINAGVLFQYPESSIAASSSGPGVSSSGLPGSEASAGSTIIRVGPIDNQPVPKVLTLDPPGYPIEDGPAKRYLMILGSALFGFIVVFSGLRSAARFDGSLGGPGRAAGILQSSFAGILPQISGSYGQGDIKFMLKRLLDVIVRNIDINIKNNDPEKPEKIVILFSMQPGEGKTFLAGNLCAKLIRQGKNILYLNYSAESLIKNEVQQSGSDGIEIPGYLSGNGRSTLLKMPAGKGKETEHTGKLFENPSRYLESTEYLEYTIDKAFLDSKSYWDLLIQNSFGLTFIPDYVFIELPPLLFFQYPPGLFAEADLPVLVCRSDRKWTEADQMALKTIGRLTNKEIFFILNRADRQAVKSVLGEFS